VVTQAEISVETTRQDNVERILDSAERLFRHYGYTKTNVADIARDLGMSPANIYRFFPSKVAIHQAIAERMLNVMYVALLTISKVDMSACDRLRQYAESNYQFTIDMMTSEKKVHEMVIVALEQHWPVVEHHMDRVQAVLQMVIRQGIDAGEFPEQDEVVAARCFCACLAQTSHPVLVAQFSGDSRAPTIQQLVQFGINGLKCGR
jgi:AcrR family transcriptional regulator